MQKPSKKIQIISLETGNFLEIWLERTHTSARNVAIVIVAATITYLAYNPYAINSSTETERRIGRAIHGSLPLIVYIATGAWIASKTVPFLTKKKENQGEFDIKY